MRQVSIFLLTFIFFNSCKQYQSKENRASENSKYEQIKTTAYELHKPYAKPAAVLILFGGYPENAEDIKREFQILEKAKENKIAIVYSNFNRKLWFESNELRKLAMHFQQLLAENNLSKENVYLGGFSSGGDVSLLLGDYLTQNEKLGFAPKGIFIIDSPIDLAELYFSSEKNLERNFSKPSIQESNWIISELGNRFGNPNEDLNEYEKHSVFTMKTGKIDNVKYLKNTRLRMYTEPDTLWWKKNRMADYKQTNAYLIREMSELLKDSGFTNVEYIPTENKGYRANGDRHPHSWSIVDKDDLISWILNE